MKTAAMASTTRTIALMSERVPQATEAGRTPIRIHGDMDLSRLAELRHELRSAASDCSSTPLSLDLTQVGFLSIRAARMVRDFANRVSRQGGAVQIVTSSRAVTRALNVVSLNQNTVHAAHIQDP